MKGMSDRKTADVKIYLAQFILELEKSVYFDQVKLIDEIYPEENSKNIESEIKYGFELVGYLNK